jgi:hypothetical protein
MIELFLEESPLHVVAGGPGFERLNFADEFANVVELAVNRDVAHVGDRIDLVKFVHHFGSDDVGGDFGDMILVQIGQDFLHRPVEAVHRDGALLAGLDQTPEKLLPVDGFPASILLHNPQFRALDLLVGGVAVGAVEAFATPPNRRPVL